MRRRLSLLLACFLVQSAGSVMAQESVEDIILRVWPDDTEHVALKIAHRESRYVPHVIGCNGRCYGIFQIVFAVHRSWLRELGIVEPQQLLDPETNAKAALKLHQLTNQDWTPWCHGSGFPRYC